MNKKISLGAAIAYMAIVAAVAFSLTMIYSMNLFNVKMTGITEREKMYSSLHEVDLYVRENYYGSINEEALQDFGRAKVVGARTAGNGDITEIFKLSGGSAIQVTTAQYAGPKQKSFGDTGVGPDYEVELAASESNRGDILGNAELDAPYKKALEVLAAAIR